MKGVGIGGAPTRPNTSAVLSKSPPRKKHSAAAKEWEPPPRHRQRLSQVNLMAEDAIENPAHVSGRPSVPLHAARESVESQKVARESQDSEESRQSVSAQRASVASRGSLGMGSRSMGNLGDSKVSVQRRRTDILGPKLSVQQLVSDVEAGGVSRTPNSTDVESPPPPPSGHGQYEH